MAWYCTACVSKISPFTGKATYLYVNPSIEALKDMAREDEKAEDEKHHAKSTYTLSSLETMSIEGQIQAILKRASIVSHQVLAGMVILPRSSLLWSLMLL